MINHLSLTTTCSVKYSGRTRSKRLAGAAIVLIKPDGSVLTRQ
ncbi:MAG TPA: DUF91 domain-containing protein [Methanosarcinales archaeon]|nr:DUF91 domain-containing protein [Methanosarcinales archaeon]